MLAPSSVENPTKLQGKILFIGTKGDWSVDAMKKGYEAAPGVKRLTLLDGKAHAQHIFKTPQGPELLRHIIEWLTKERTSEQ